MPELPEVETIRLGLSKKIVGLKVKNVEVLNAKSLQFDPKLIRGKKVLKIERKAKILIANLADKNSLLFHLKMSGQLIYMDNRVRGGRGRFTGGHPTQDMVLAMPNKSTRVIFTFSDNSKLYFNDQRKFGWIKLVRSDELEEVGGLLKNLGPEPLEKEFTWRVLRTQLLKHKNWEIKVALMDQQIISGIGNIYASEAMFNAKLDPRTKVVELTDEQLKRLHQGVVKALKDGIKHGGSSRTHFVNEEGKKGLFLDYAYVYRRDKQPCKICGSKIETIRQGGRSTFFCPKCQK